MFFEPFNELYYITDYTATLFTSEGFKVLQNSYVQRKTVNKKEDITAERIFIQGKFEKLSGVHTSKKTEQNDTQRDSYSNKR